MYARLRCGGNLPLPRPGVDGPLRGNCHPLSCTPDNQVRCVFGSAPYQKPPSVVRGAFSEAFGVKNRLLRYGRDIRCQKQPSVVRDASSKARRTADSTGRGQLPGVRDAFSEAYRAKSSTCRTGRIFSARNAHRSDVIRLKRGCIPWKSLRIHPPPF